MPDLNKIKQAVSSLPAVAKGSLSLKELKKKIGPEVYGILIFFIILFIVFFVVIVVGAIKAFNCNQTGKGLAIILLYLFPTGITQIISFILAITAFGCNAKIMPV